MARVKPIIDAELCVSEDPASGQRRRLVALCQNTTGYRNLAGLLTRSYTDDANGAELLLRLLLVTLTYLP